jgi:WD40 repeat protein
VRRALLLSLATILPAAALTLPAGPNQAVITAGPALPISAVAFSPDSKAVLVGGYQEILQWDLEKAALRKRIAQGEIKGQVRALAFSKDGKYLAVAEGVPSVSGAIRLLDLATGAVTATLAEAKDEMFALAFSPDGKWLAAGGADAIVRVWTLADRKPVAELKAHTDWITSLAFSPNSRLLASGSNDKTVQIWDTADWKAAVSLPQTVTEAVSGVAFSPDGSMLTFAVGGVEERAIRMWRPEVLEQAANPNVQRKPNTKFTRPFDTGSCLPMGVVWASTGRPRFFVPCTDKTVRVLNNNGGFLFNMNGHQDWVYGAASNADGSRVASGSADGTVRIWNGVDGAPLATLVQLRPRTDEWLILTARGSFTTSNPSAIALRKDGKPLSADAVSNLQNTQAVRDALAGKPPAKPVPAPQKVTD